MSAKKPSTTEGNPARSSTTGLMISLSQVGANSAVKTAAPTAKGTANSIAMMVIFSVPKNSGMRLYFGSTETGCQT